MPHFNVPVATLQPGDLFQEPQMGYRAIVVGVYDNSFEADIWASLEAGVDGLIDWVWRDEPLRVELAKTGNVTLVMEGGG